MNQRQQLLALAQNLVDECPDFFDVKGPGAGDLATSAFMDALRQRSRQQFGEDYAEKKICGSNGFCVDYYFPDEATIVEVALGLPKPKTEFERDVLKAIMAKEAGYKVKCLFFISKPGAKKKSAQPGRMGIIDWLSRNHDIAVEVHELTADPRPS